MFGTSTGGGLASVLGSQAWDSDAFLKGFGIDPSTVDKSKLTVNGITLDQIPEGMSLTPAIEILEKMGTKIYGSMGEAMKAGGNAWFYDKDGALSYLDGEYSGGFPVVNVTQNIYSETKTAADLMEEALYQQRKAVAMGV
jgi:hypothetical protein